MNDMTIRVKAMIVDTRELTLYKENGDTVTIPQGDPRLKAIVDEHFETIKRREIAIVSLASENTYSHFEEKTNGLVKFFRIAKKKVAHLFGLDEEEAEPVEPLSVGLEETKAGVDNLIQEGQQIAAAPAPKAKAPLQPLGAGILSGAEPVSSRSYAERQTRDDETIVAVVDGKVIPGAEMLQRQFASVFAGNSHEGLTNLLTRLSKMIDKRGHSVEDILKFLQNSDLNVATNGDIIAYKLVTSRTRHDDKVVAKGKGIYYDCHSQMVPQRVGSVVCVDESMVDKNRRNECSNGLHVATRAYLAGFTGDVVLQIRIAPEDIITVPHGDATKVRVCRYHIVAELTRPEYDRLKANKSMTEGDKNSQANLAKILAGDHVGRLEEVRIHGQYGQDVRITAIKPGHDISDMLPIVKNETAAKKATSLDDIESKSRSVVDPKEVAAKASTKADPKKDHLGRDEKGVTEGMRKYLNKDTPNPAQASAMSRAESTPKPAATGSERTRTAAEFYARMSDKDNTDADRRQAALALKGLKSKAKVSYASLGLTGPVGDEVQEILDIMAEPRQTEPAPSPKATKSKLSNGVKEVVNAKNEPIKSAPQPKPQAKAKQAAKSQPKAKTPAKPVKAEPVKQVKVQKTVTAAPVETRAEKANRLFILASDSKSSTEQRAAATELKAFKAKAKVSWTELGLDSVKAPALLKQLLG